ncbi:NADH-quinone oxidoreductase subunit J [Candidatus Pantoea carbekii]|uniref:NADH-quinone oxidoreductase subunit J n=1 Tax=Candidatus Pantoea carbekii TaxID=1235990 RepID=U3U6E0_9GAMM|nr:NADH-quinone oxidoreductase subunit J [Candidatus Pantoea carbekii]AKC31998.1 NADH-quinone oxidoreductase chain J NuoJ [Candidatus Pantoea carbekii]BAO00520.1 NuoJ protein [Candidatus Pantoea carbekii]
MEFAFYFCGLMSILTTFRFITHTNPVHALMYLIASLLSIAGVFFSIGAYFVGALEIIIYAGAIMVLFVFVVMMLNLGNTQEQEREWLKTSLWLAPAIISLILLVLIIYAIITLHQQSINGTVIDAKTVGINLFGSYAFIVELTSMLLLAGLIIAFHIGREDRQSEVLNNRSFEKINSNEENA